MELDIQLLEHEQIHFDIAEVAVRKIRASFQTFTSACAEAGGTEPIEHLIARADRDLQQEQERFDRETGARRQCARPGAVEAADTWRF